MLDEEVRQAVKHIIRFNTPRHNNGQALTRAFIDDRKDLDRPSIMSPGSHKVVGPDVVAMGWPKPDAGAVREPETGPLRLLLGHLKPLLTPDALNPLVVDLPALPPQKSSDSTVAVPTILLSKPDNCSPQGLLIVSDEGNMSLGGSGLTKNTADSPLRDTQLRLQVFNAFPAPGGA